MSDNKNLDTLAGQLADLFIGCLAQSVGQAAPDPNIVNMSMTREEFERQRKLLRDAETMQSQIAELTRQLQSARAEVETCRTSRFQRAEYNKLYKQYTACANQRNSYKATIAQKDVEIGDLKHRVAELERTMPTTVDVLVVNGVTYTAAEIAQVIKTSNERACENARLKRDLDSVTSERDAAVKDNRELVRRRKQAEEVANHLKERARVYVLNGQPISDDRLKFLCELGFAAEQAGLPMTRLMAIRDHQEAEPELEPYRVVIHDASNTTISISLPDNKQLDIAAELIPHMANDIQSKQQIIENLKRQVAEKEEVRVQLASSVRAAEDELMTLRDNISTMSKRLMDKDAEIQRLTIERNLTRGQLNKLRAFKTPATVNGQVLQAGEAYMTTALGMLPINSNGMRQLSDALDEYRAKVQRLTSGLKEWIKS